MTDERIARFAPAPSANHVTKCKVKLSVEGTDTQWVDGEILYARSNRPTLYRVDLGDWGRHWVDITGDRIYVPGPSRLGNRVEIEVWNFPDARGIVIAERYGRVQLDDGRWFDANHIIHSELRNVPQPTTQPPSLI